MTAANPWAAILERNERWHAENGAVAIRLVDEVVGEPGHVAALNARSLDRERAVTAYDARCSRCQSGECASCDGTAGFLFRGVCICPCNAAPAIGAAS